MNSLDDKHRLAIGDKLSFRIEEEQREPKPLIVTDSGDLEVPYIGRFPAENKTCKQLAQELKAALEKEYFYQATVILAVDFKTRRQMTGTIGPSTGFANRDFGPGNSARSESTWPTGCRHGKRAHLKDSATFASSNGKG